jgi:hypothetical protein
MPNDRDVGFEWRNLALVSTSVVQMYIDESSSEMLTQLYIVGVYNENKKQEEGKLRQAEFAVVEKNG